MPTTPSPPLPQTCAPPSHPLRPPSVFQSGTRHQSPGQAHSSQSCPYQPPPASHRPRATCPPSTPATPVNPVNQLLAVLQPGHRPARLTLPSPCLFTNTDIPSVAYKTPCNFYREGTILPVFVPCLYLCTAATACEYKYPRHPLGAPGILVKDQSVHLMILVTRPEPTVRPPSRIAKPRPSSIAMG